MLIRKYENDDIKQMINLWNEVVEDGIAFPQDEPLNEETGVISPASAKGAAKPEEKQPLDEIIEKINEQYKGAFTDADRVLLTALRAKLMGNAKLQSMAQTSDPQIFMESIFPKAFDNAAQDSYMESQDTYTTLFEDQAKYNAIMHALGSIIYREMRMNV